MEYCIYKNTLAQKVEMLNRVFWRTNANFWLEWRTHERSESLIVTFLVYDLHSRWRTLVPTSISYMWRPGTSSQTRLSMSCLSCGCTGWKWQIVFTWSERISPWFKPHLLRHKWRNELARGSTLRGCRLMFRRFHCLLIDSAVSACRSVLLESQLPWRKFNWHAVKIVFAFKPQLLRH